MKRPEQPFKLKNVVLFLGEFEPRFYDFFCRMTRATRYVVLEGRPNFSSSRDTCRELICRKITPTVIADNMSGFLFKHHLVKEVWVAYQTADKDGVLCDVGGLILGVLARRHKVPFYAFPGIKKNHFVGNPDDVCSLAGIRTAPKGVKGFVPLIDFVPKKYVRKICQIKTSRN